MIASKPLFLILAVLAAAPLAAQEAGTPTETPDTAETDTGTDGATTETSGDLSLGTVEGEGDLGTDYVAETFDDWQMTCVKTEDGNDPCQLYQLLKDASGNSVAEVNLIALPEGQQAVAGATIVTPLETLLTEQVRLAVDGNKAKLYPFTFCAAVGCIARVGFTAEEVAQLKSGNKATLTIVPLAAPDKTVDLNLSLKGFTKGFDAVSAKIVPVE